MASTPHDRVSELFLEVCDLAPGEQQAFLDRECPDPTLRREVESLLAADRTGSLGGTVRLGAAVRDVAAAAPQAPPTGRNPPGALPTIPGYEIVRTLGSGGAGTVYEALQIGMQRRVALKVLHAAGAQPERLRERFEREAWIAGRLNHPHIVKVFDRGQADGVSYYSMELVGGGSLKDVVQAMRTTGSHAGLGMTSDSGAYARWAIQQGVFAARALDYTRRNGIVHRDIKPANLLLDAETRAIKLADFGIALDTEATRVTSEGFAIGTFSYMAPEQLLGKNAAIDHRSDIYALGVTLYEILVGQRPYRGDTLEQLITAVTSGPRPHPRKTRTGISRDLETVLLKCLEREPQYRYATAGELGDDLEAILDLRPIRVRPPSATTRIWKWVRRKPVHAALLVLLVVGLAAGSWFGAGYARQRSALRAARILQLEGDVNRFEVEGRDTDMARSAAELVALDPDHRFGLKSWTVATYNLSVREENPARREELQQEALQHARTTVETFPDLAWPHRLEAYLLERFGRSGEAANERRVAEGLESGGEDDWLLEGAVSAASGELERAEELFTKALTLRPRSDALRRRGEVRARMGRHREALDDFRSMIALNPGSVIGHRKAGRECVELGRFDEARQHLGRALELAPEDPRTHEELAFEADRRARTSGLPPAEAAAAFREAESWCRKGLERSPDRPWLHISLGASLVEQVRLEARGPAAIDEAVEHYDAAVRLGGGADARSGAAVEAEVLACDALLLAGKAAEAAPRCERAADRSPNNAVAFYNLAGAYALAGRRQDALAALERDLELGDTDYDYLRGDPWFESIRDEPRFRDVLRRMQRKATSE